MDDIESEWPFGEGALDFEFVYHSTNRRDLSEDEFYNDGCRHMNEEEWRRYCDQVHASDGFDVDDFPECIDYGIIIPTSLSYETDTLQHYTDFAIRWYNTENKKNLKLVEFIKWNQQGCSPMNYYITFKAEDGGKVDTYQAMVVSRCPDEKSYVETFRIKPEKGKGKGKADPDHSLGKGKGKGKADPDNSLGKGKGKGKSDPDHSLEKGKGKGKADPDHSLGKGKGKGKVDPDHSLGKEKGKGKADPDHSLEKGKGKGKADPDHSLGRGKGKGKGKGKADPDHSLGKGKNKGYCC